MFESEGGGMRNSASQMNSGGLLSGADGLNELLLILGDHYIPTVQVRKGGVIFDIGIFNY